MRWAGQVARMGDTRNAYRILVGKLEGKRQLRGHRCRWEDDIVTCGPIARKQVNKHVSVKIDSWKLTRYGTHFHRYE
jgi:hypothetical protein